MNARGLHRADATRWPTRAIVVGVCGCLVALWAIAAPASRAGTPIHHRPAGKIVLTAETHHQGSSGWDQSPDQDLVRPAKHHAAAARLVSAPTSKTVVHQHVQEAHSRGPPA